MRPSLKPLAGVVVCSTAALVLSLFLVDARETRFVAPPMCLLVVIVATVYFGRLAGILGAAAAGCVLAFLLYPPFGTLFVEERAARAMLSLFLIGAGAVAVMVPSAPRRKRKPGAKRATQPKEI